MTSPVATGTPVPPPPVTPPPTTAATPPAAGGASAPATSSEFGLKEAITLKHSYVDQSHKFWGYFQLAAAAATGFAWQTKPPTDNVLYGLAIGFLAFGIGNNRLVVGAHAAAYQVSAAIDRYLAAHPAAPSPELAAVANLRRLDEAKTVRLLHIVLTGVVIALILVRTSVN
jgi:hypothetical protein